MLDYDEEKEGAKLEDVVCRTFSVDVMLGDGSETRTVDLIPDGSQIYVNKDNREDFVRLFIEFDVQVQSEARLEAFWRGMARFVDPVVLEELFEIEELPTLLSGQ